MKYFEKLGRLYRNEIRKWNWKEIEQKCCDNSQWCEDGFIAGRAYLGLTVCLVPSGRLYTRWTTSRTIRDAIHGKAYVDALEDVSAEYGLSITVCGEDLFAETKLSRSYDFKMLPRGL